MKMTGEMLDDAIRTEFERMLTLTEGSDEYKRAYDRLRSLYTLKIDESKISVDEKIKLTQMLENAKDRKIDVLIKVGEIVVPSVLTLIFVIWGFKFEETGTFTSNVFRIIWSKFKLGKK